MPFHQSLLPSSPVTTDASDEEPQPVIRPSAHRQPRGHALGQHRVVSAAELHTVRVNGEQQRIGVAVAELDDEILALMNVPQCLSSSASSAGSSQSQELNSSWMLALSRTGSASLIRLSRSAKEPSGSAEESIEAQAIAWTVQPMQCHWPHDIGIINCAFVDSDAVLWVGTRNGRVLFGAVQWQTAQIEMHLCTLAAAGNEQTAAGTKGGAEEWHSQPVSVLCEVGQRMWSFGEDRKLMMWK